MLVAWFRIQRILRSLQVFDPVQFSMSDLVRTAEGSLVTEFTDFCFELTQHVLECEHCKEKGIICEICQDPRPFHPFQLGISIQCPDCKVFFHRACFTKLDKCPRCEQGQSQQQKKDK